MTRSCRILPVLALAALVPQLAAGQTYTVAPPPFLMAFDNSGRIISGSCVWTYIAGTTTAATTYSDNAGTPNSNPIRSDSAGRFTAFLVPGNAYKFQYETSCTPPSHGTLLVTKDNIAAMPASAASVDVQGTAGESITAGQCVYLSDGSGSKTAGQWFKCDSANPYSSTFPEIGIATAAIASAATGTVRTAGQVTGLTSLTVGAEYFVSGTGGAITSTAPSNKRHVGHADSATSLILTGNPPLPTVTAGVGIAVTAGAGTVTVKQTSAEVTLTDGATPALDASLGFVFRLSAAGDRTIAVPTNPTAGQRIIIEHFASGGTRTLALNTGAGGFRFGTDVTALTITSSGKTDYIGCIYNATDSKWDVVAYVKGY